jgi:hypothetical protein
MQKTAHNHARAIRTFSGRTKPETNNLRNTATCQATKRKKIRAASIKKAQ